MTATPRVFARFDDAFAMAFEEEVLGETFFAALGEAEPDPRRAALWAKVALIEQRTVAALRPLAEALGVTPADEAEVRRIGRDQPRTDCGTHGARAFQQSRRPLKVFSVGAGVFDAHSAKTVGLRMVKRLADP